MMSDPILIIDSNLELEVLEHQNPELENAPLILLSNNFSPQQLNEYSDRGYIYFDDPITNEDAIRLSDDIHHLIWNWFLDESGRDLSLLNGCSLGRAFASSLEILFNTILRYLHGLEKLLNVNHIVYYSDHSEDIFLDVIIHLQRKIGFAVRKIETNRHNKKIIFGKYNLKIDPGGRKRDLAPMFSRNNWKSWIISFLLLRLQKTPKNKKRILFMPGGKMNSYFDHIRKNGCPEGFRWILPIAGLGDFISGISRRPLFYHFSNTRYNRSTETSSVIFHLKDNLRQTIKFIDPDLIIKLMERYTFKYFEGAYKYFLNALEMFHSLKPELAIFSSDVYEDYNISAMAAKQAGIKTLIIPHGLYIWGYKETKSGQFKIFDYGLAFGQVDVDTYVANGMPKKNVRISSFPYFEKFLPRRKKRNLDYRRALVLSPDNYNMCPGEKIAMENKFYLLMSRLLKELEIEFVGIKARHHFHFQNIGSIEDSLNIDGTEIPLISGYSSLPKVVNEVDMVIGPASTALIETNLLGKDYYIYQHAPFHEFTSSISSSLLGFVNASFNIDQLRENIMNKQPYKPGCSVDDFLDLKDVNNREELFSKFESRILSVLELNQHNKSDAIPALA
jgi:hypothetical protein